MAKIYLNKENKVGNFPLPDSKAYYKIAGIRRVKYCSGIDKPVKRTYERAQNRPMLIRPLGVW